MWWSPRKPQEFGDRVVCLMCTAVLDLPTVLIDRNETLDIATFALTGSQAL
jgi:hypothetical protein